MLLERNNGSLQAYPDLLLVEAGVHGDLLPHAHVGVTVPLEERLQLLQLLRREVCPLPPVPLAPAAALAVFVVPVADRSPRHSHSITPDSMVPEKGRSFVQNFKA